MKHRYIGKTGLRVSPICMGTMTFGSTCDKEESFKINEIDPNLLWINKKDTVHEKDLHSFLWLNLIDRKSDGKSLQKIIIGKIKLEI